MTKVTVNLPFFPGFYESSLSRIVESAVEQESEHANEKQTSQTYYPESYYPEQLRVDYSEFLWDCVNYGDAYRAIAKDYCAAFDSWMNENCDTPAGSFQFESMDSPREYNFTTDRVYVTVDESVMAELLLRTPLDALAAVIKARHSSRSGFISFYSDDIGEWMDSDEFDHNELGTILVAAMGEDPDESDSFRWSMVESLYSEDWKYLDSNCDWQKVDQKAIEARGERLAEWIKSDIEAAAAWLRGNTESGELLAIAADNLDSDELAALDEFQTGYMDSHYRCPYTRDLFAC